VKQETSIVYHVFRKDKEKRKIKRCSRRQKKRVMSIESGVFCKNKEYHFFALERNPFYFKALVQIRKNTGDEKQTSKWEKREGPMYNTDSFLVTHFEQRRDKLPDALEN